MQTSPYNLTSSLSHTKGLTLPFLVMEDPMRFYKPLLVSLALLFTTAALAGGGKPKVSTEYDAALAEAGKSGKIVVLHFWMPGCAPCNMMERTTFKDPRLRQKLTEVVFLKIKLTDKKNAAVGMKYGIRTVPADVFLDPSGNETGRLGGYWNADGYMEQIGKHQAKLTPVKE